MNVIKVAIADDHKIFRKGVVLSLRPYANIKFVLEAENGDELLAGLPEAQPDVERALLSKHNILFLNPSDAQRAGIMAAVPCINNDAANLQP